MALNTNPIFGGTPIIGWDAAMTTANTSKDGTSGTTYTVFTAGADGAFLEKLVFQPIGNNVVSLARLFINNGGSTGTLLNNTLYDQINLPVISGFSEAAAFQPVERLLNLRLPPNYVVFLTLATAVASGWRVTAVGASLTAA